MGTMRKSVAMGVAVALMVGAVAAAAGSPSGKSEASSRGEYSRFLAMKPGALSGRVLYADCRTPAAEVAVRVWSTADKRFVHRGATDKEGTYAVPKQAPGRYVVVYADRVGVDLRVDEAAAPAPQPLDVIIPRGKAFTLPEDKTGGTPAGVVKGGTLLKSVVVLGATGGIAVGVLAATDNLGGGSHHDDETPTKKKVVSP